MIIGKKYIADIKAKKKPISLHRHIPPIHDKGNKCSFKLDIQLFHRILLVELRGKSISYAMLKNKRNIFFFKQK